MGTINQGSVKWVTLDPDHILTVAAAAASAVVVYQYDGEVGGQNTATTSVAASASATFGPFTAAKRFLIDVNAGTATDTVARAAFTTGEAGVLATVLAGFSAATRTVVTAAHTVLQALGFLQAQINSPWGAATTIASSTTPAIGAAATPYIILSGTTSVTGFDTAAPVGAVRKVRYSGAVPLVHGANLILIGAANRTVAVGDISEFLYEGSSVWREVGAVVAADLPSDAAGGGGGGGGGGGSDRTAVTTESDPVYGGYRPIAETVDGIPWSNITYDVYSRETSREWVAGALTRTISYAGNLGVASGAIIRAGGEVTVTVSQMATVKTALAALGAALTGTPRFYISDFSSGRALSVEWNDVDACFRGVGGAELVLGHDGTQSAAHTTTTESAALSTINSPAWLAGPKGQWRQYVEFKKTGVANTWDTNCKANGIAVANYSGLGATSITARMAGYLCNRDSLSSNSYLGSLAHEGSASTAAWVDGAIATGSGFDFTVTVRLNSGTGDSAFMRVHRVTYQHP